MRELILRSRSVQFCVSNQYEPVNQACVCVRHDQDLAKRFSELHVHVSMHAYAYIFIVSKFHSLACICDDITRRLPAGLGGCGIKSLTSVLPPALA